MGNSHFFQSAVELINAETKKLESFCDTLDKDPVEKKNRIAEYKCAKYRYAGVTNVWCRFFFSHRVAKNNIETHYLIPQLNDIFITIPKYVAFFDNAPDEEKLDYALYYGTVAFTDYEIAKFEDKLANATDWEKVEIKERIDGMQFAKECLNKAWQRRKEVMN